MTDLLERSARASYEAAWRLVAFIQSGAPVTRRDLNTAMTIAFGGTDADGFWTQRDSFEMLEHALALTCARSAASEGPPLICLW